MTCPQQNDVTHDDDDDVTYDYDAMQHDDVMRLVHGDLRVTLVICSSWAGLVACRAAPS